MYFEVVRRKVRVEETDELFLSMPLIEFRLSGGGRLAPLASAPALPIGRVDIYVEILAAICKLFSCDTLRRELVYGRFVNIPYEPVKTRFALDFLPLHTVPESAIIIKV